jgi:hypothetical protein
MVVAMFDFRDEDGDDQMLELKEGTVFSLMEQAEGWGRGELSDGRSGWFPMSYVKDHDGSTAAAAAAEEEEEPEPQGPIPVAERVYAKAAYAYDARSEDEIDLAEGDVVVLLEHECMEGWSRAQNRRRVGLYPTAYCEPLTVSALGDVKVLVRWCWLAGLVCNLPSCAGACDDLR